MHLDKVRVKGKLILLFVAIVWGFAFVFQNQAIEYMDAFTLNGLRCIVAALFLIPVIIYRSKKKKEAIIPSDKKQRKDLIVSSVICGLFLFVAMNVQQFGMSLYPSDAAVSGRSGFITALYVVFVPVLGLFFKNKLKLGMVVSVLLATLGMYFLCFSHGISKVYIGDFVVLLCALGFSFQILFIDKYSDRVDGVKLSFLEFIICGVLSMILMFIFEQPDISRILQAWLPILYLGIVSSGIGYTLQIIGQQYSKSPTVDSIIMSFESVFAAIGGALILHQKLTTLEAIGCAIMFIAIIVAQLPEKPFIKQIKK